MADVVSRPPLPQTLLHMSRVASHTIPHCQHATTPISWNTIPLQS
jgi:hypothetical protein